MVRPLQTDIRFRSKCDLHSSPRSAYRVTRAHCSASAAIALLKPARDCHRLRGDKIPLNVADGGTPLAGVRLCNTSIVLGEGRQNAMISQCRTAIYRTSEISPVRRHTMFPSEKVAGEIMLTRQVRSRYPGPR